MTNRTKWLIALPFAFVVAAAVPALIAGDWLWFRGDPAAMLFVTLSAGMWLVATAFVDVNRPRGPRDAANLLLPLGLILGVPLAVADRLYGPAGRMPGAISIAGGVLVAAAAVIGLWARRSLGAAYGPRGTVTAGAPLVTGGPYRLIRHPLYTAALLWVLGWPLLVGSFLAAGGMLLLILPALARRMAGEEADLRRVHGAAYDAYCRRTWRLLPPVY